MEGGRKTEKNLEIAYYVSISCCSAVILVMFERPSYTFNEEDGMGIIEIVKSGTASEPFDIQVVGGKAVILRLQCNQTSLKQVPTQYIPLALFSKINLHCF